jgi:hypothetical protein
MPKAQTTTYLPSIPNGAKRKHTFKQLVALAGNSIITPQQTGRSALVDNYITQGLDAYNLRIVEINSAAPITCIQSDTTDWGLNLI